ncbi:SERINE/THREONINE-KINASE [Salix purpurea]|uniref:SERINE/THREONINE-KINASE n=1 Tax=Salix purpurea TaxID=77065 RepID=A0A9Q0SQK0_SALPP|nr:SERINE/THREONINE-KINASE [Salix purpurea]
MNRTLESRKDDQQEEEDDEKALAIWDLDSSLYDSHELVSLTHLIERHLMTLPSLGGSKRLSSKKTSQASVAVPAAILVSNMGSKSETKRLRFSSTLNTMSEFVKRKLRIKKRIRSHRRKDSSEKLWIKKRIRSHSRKDNSEKLKVGHCSSCIKFGL